MSRCRGWIEGEVVRITPDDPAFKVPHMGWNDLVLDASLEDPPQREGSR